MVNKKTEKGPKPPQKPMPAFFLYKKDKNEEIKASNPKVKVSEITKIAAEMWKAESADVKERYQKLFNEEREKHLVLKKKFEDEHGKPEKKPKKVKKIKKEKKEKKEKKDKAKKSIQKEKIDEKVAEPAHKEVEPVHH